KSLSLLHKLLISCLLLLGLMSSQEALAQSPVSITGDTGACVGDVKAYTPGISNSAYAYNWDVSPSGAGVVLSGSSTGSSIQWMTPGVAQVTLYITDPLDGNNTLYSGSLSVTVSSLPSPHITSNIRLGCQPLNDSLPRGEGEVVLPE